jgi:hypothetical protein
MSITTSFLVGSIAALVMGIIVGWYVTRQHYRLGIIEREAINGYINHQKTKNPPPTAIERVQKAMDTLQDFVTRYHIEWGETEWDYIEDKNSNP